MGLLWLFSTPLPNEYQKQQGEDYVSIPKGEDPTNVSIKE